MNWLWENKEWIFSGIGAAILIAVFGATTYKRYKIKQQQKAGDNATLVQIGNIEGGYKR